jgi:hypothetical protein
VETSEDVTIQLEDRLPTSLGDMDESYKNDIIACDTSAATDTPVRILALLARSLLL